MDPHAVERRLAAILVADVAGYSRLMAEDEEVTIRTISAYRAEVELLVGQHRGRLVDFTGDNFLAEFPTALEAVRCAVEIQKVLAARNSDLPPERRLEFRMGVHLGDVASEGERLYGDGVNIAARLQALAAAGGISVSGEVHNLVRSKLSLGFVDLGSQAVKNIPEPVRVYRLRVETQAAASGRRPRVGPAALVAVAVIAFLSLGSFVLWRLLPGLTPAGFSDAQFTVPGFGGSPAIAVLPFDNLSGDPEQEYFADGMAEELITRLSSGSFPVIARNSTFTYKGTAVNVQQVGRELGARYVIEGSVRKDDNRVRISAQLIDATNGHHVWAETYDREEGSLFAIQDEITESITSSLGIQLYRAESERAAREEPRSLDSWHLAMQGAWHFFKLTADDNAKARSLFERAIELNPSATGALAALADTHAVDVLFQWSDSAPRSIGELERAARKCVAVSAQEARCQLRMGLLASLTGQRDEMFNAFEAAVRIAPSNPNAHFYLGVYSATNGRPEEGLVHLERAMRLSPKDPLRGMHLYGVAIAHFAAGQYEAAVDWAQRSVTLAPDFLYGHLVLVVSNARLGRRNDAGRALEGLLRVQPELSTESS